MNWTVLCAWGVGLGAALGTLGCGPTLDVGKSQTDGGAGGGDSGATGDGSRSETPPGPGVGGTTACGVQTCQAGTFCLNMVCAPGCLAETNCTSAQDCTKSGGNNVGSCEAKTQVPVSNCGTFCPKYQDCYPQDWMAGLTQCSQVKGRTCVCADLCGALKSSCITCFNSAATCGDAKSCDTLCK